ncbi:MAG: phosphoribosylanthranilate isomerase [Synoicihabitans sp.]
MVDGVRLKFCGLTSLVDAIHADKLGADYLGFILHPKSPRYIALRDFKNLAPNLPQGRKRVAVMVAPDAEELLAAREAGFDRFQLHFSAETNLSKLAEWRELVGRDRLWLAPRRPPGSEFKNTWLEFAATFLMDTYAPDKFGGSGQTGDWGEFKRLMQMHPDHTWVIAGGLTSENMETALDQTQARVVDVNSGVELTPGVKDHAQMNAVVMAIHRQRTAANSSHV